MKKTYKIEGLDCANCALKVEDVIRKVPGVKDASVSFLTEKLKVDFDENVDVETTLREIKKVTRKVESECEIL